MEKPVITKKLAMIAMILAGVSFLWAVIAALCPELYINLYIILVEDEITALFRMANVLKAVWGFLPYTVIGVWSYLQKKVTNNSAIGILSTVGIFYLLHFISLYFFGNIISRMLAYASDAEAMVIYTSINRMQSYVAPLQTAAMVLLCCSAAIELYAVTQKGGNMA